MAMSAVALMTAVVSAQGEAPGIRPAASLPSGQVPGVLGQVGFAQHLDATLPLELPFTDEAGRAVKLGDYFGRKPVVLAFVYYECPMLCTQVLNGLESSLRVINESIGKEFDVVTVSFDARETPLLAAAKKQAYLDRYKRPEAAQGWHFLTGSQASIDALTSRPVSATCGTSSRSSSRTRAASSWPRPRAGCRATSSASTTRRATSSSR